MPILRTSENRFANLPGYPFAGTPRESLYRALGPRGNPWFSTLTAIMEAIGMRLTVTAA